jgi:hypothetical protein
MSEAPEGYALVPVDKSTKAAAEAARALLAVADHPREVVWRPGRSEFLVPDAVAERYREVLNGAAEPKTTRPRRTKRSDSNG